MKKLLSASAALVLCICNAQAAPNSAQRVRAFAKLPDWSGMWESVVTMDKADFTPVPFNSEWQAKADAARTQQSIRYYCAEGMPLMMLVPDKINMFSIVVAPEATMMNFSTHEVRHIYTDGRRHPSKADLLLTPVGDSIGHWEGDTLVIDTIGTRPMLQSIELVEFRPGHPSPAAIKSVPTSEQLHMIERVRLVGPDELEDLILIEDPIAFSHPMTETLKYQRVTDIDRMIYDDCVENERWPIVGGKVTPVEHPLATPVPVKP